MESWEGAGGHSRPSAVGSGQPLSAGSLGARAFQTGNQRCSLAKDIRAASPRQQFISSDMKQPIPAHSLEELPSAGTYAGVHGKGLGQLTTAADFCCHGPPCASSYQLHSISGDSTPPRSPPARQVAQAWANTAWPG